MTEERLKFLEAHFRNPHSAGGLSEYGLELVDALRVLNAEASSAKHVYAASTSAAGDHRLAQVAPEPKPVDHDAPTPPHGVDRKKGKR